MKDCNAIIFTNKPLNKNPFINLLTRKMYESGS